MISQTKEDEDLADREWRMWQAQLSVYLEKGDELLPDDTADAMEMLIRVAKQREELRRRNKRLMKILVMLMEEP